MSQGQISKNKVKTTIILEKDLKSSLEVLAKKEMRSLNNLMASVLSEYVKSRTGADQPSGSSFMVLSSTVSTVLYNTSK